MDIYLTGPRVAYTLAVKKTLPASDSLAKLNKGGVPANSIWLIAVLASIYALTGQFNLLTDLTVFTIWIFYVLTFIGVIKLLQAVDLNYKDHIKYLYIQLYQL